MSKWILILFWGELMETEGKKLLQTQKLVKDNL